MSINKLKIINDPFHGFIKIPYEILYDVIEHRFFQRLRRISQTGLLSLVFPGATHTRFHHAIGAMHLMYTALETLKQKGVKISEEEEKSALLAILLHDVGHGPYSHALESLLMEDWHHEKLSILLMHKLNEEFNGQLSMAIEMFQGKYHRSFFNQLISSQLDVDRLDYLNRDSFFTGVSEGIIGSDRLIEMLNVHNGNLVLEEKGIYSIEKFIVARRLMYWQVYLHKTVVSAEFMLIHALRRAKQLVKEGKELFASPTLMYFLKNDVRMENFKNDPSVLDKFAALDDYDILGAIKVWQEHSDRVLSMLSTRLVNRDLFKIEISKDPFSPDRIRLEKEMVRNQFELNDEEIEFFVYTDVLSNNAYNQHKQNINMLMKNGEIIDLSKASDNLNISALANPVEKYFLCYPIN